MGTASYRGGRASTLERRWGRSSVSSPLRAQVPGILAIRDGLWTRVSTLAPGLSYRVARALRQRWVRPPSWTARSTLYSR